MGDIDWSRTMTPRARGYLVIAGVRHLLIGMTCIVAAPLFVSPAFAQIKAVLPIPLWGLLFLAVAAVCLPAAVIGNGRWARVGLILSAASTAVWGCGFLAAIALDVQAGRPLSGPTGVVVYLAIAAKDLVVCRNPMRSPFEDLAAHITDIDSR